MAIIANFRRYALMKIRTHVRLDMWELAAAWRAKQDAHAGTPLPASFPHLSQLSAARYITREDLDGATPTELQQEVGLNRAEADAVLAAFAALT